jgi:hypothetical protein
MHDRLSKYPTRVMRGSSTSFWLRCHSAWASGSCSSNAFSAQKPGFHLQEDVGDCDFVPAEVEIDVVIAGIWFVDNIDQAVDGADLSLRQVAKGFLAGYLGASQAVRQVCSWRGPVWGFANSVTSPYLIHGLDPSISAEPPRGSQLYRRRPARRNERERARP